ncbi:uncharacterized protein V1513DRAFT_452011 [Lipomyces chichibuensis]|uniref:uncharacterized protein n=1 Tax=Lipomyces chichibuensis TaxID=1546026 RepID=UPI00334411E6
MLSGSIHVDDSVSANLKHSLLSFEVSGSTRTIAISKDNFHIAPEVIFSTGLGICLNRSA